MESGLACCGKVEVRPTFLILLFLVVVAQLTFTLRGLSSPSLHLLVRLGITRPKTLVGVEVLQVGVGLRAHSVKVAHGAGTWRRAHAWVWGFFLLAAILTGSLRVDSHQIPQTILVSRPRFGWNHVEALGSYRAWETCRSS